MNKIKELLVDKKKRVIAIAVVTCIFLISGIGVYALSRSSKVILKGKQEVIVEYGEKVSTEVKDYVITTDLSKEDKALVLKNAKVKVVVENEADKEYPAIGEYKVTITYEVSKVETKVIVKDTIEPVFNEINEIEFIQGTEFDYAEYIKATDLQEVTYDFNTELVDSNTVGEYTMQVLATDGSGNEAKKDIKVNVLEKPTEESEVEVVTDPETGKVTTKITSKETTGNADTSSSNTTSSNNNSNSSNNTSSSNTNSNGSTNNTNSSNNTNSNNNSNNSSSGSNNTFKLPEDTAQYKFFATESDMNKYVKSLNGADHMAGNAVDPTTGTQYYYVWLG